MITAFEVNHAPIEPAYAHRFDYKGRSVVITGDLKDHRRWQANVKHLAFYHLLPSPDGALPRRLFSQGINRARTGDWSITDDGSLYTMPIGSTELRMGRVER